MVVNVPPVLDRASPVPSRQRGEVGRLGGRGARERKDSDDERRTSGSVCDRHAILLS
jgi:hypothetical protein